MAIDPALFAKAAKVYEAAESVEGMKPKEVYESHKKCAPGEFGMNKEGQVQFQQAIAQLANAQLRKQAVFSMEPAVFSPGRTAMMGAAGGGALGAGLGGLIGGLYGAHVPGEEHEYDAKGRVTGLKRRSALHGALRGLAAGGAIGGVAGAGLGGTAGYTNADMLENERRKAEFENMMHQRFGW